MKCPKCGYLGFEAVDRCRNCGYDFSFTPTNNPPELPIRSSEIDDLTPFDDLALSDALSRAQTPGGRRDSVDDLGRRPTPERGRDAADDLPLFGPPHADDVPLITHASAPRQPLSVRRAAPEVSRLRAEPRASTPSSMPMLDLEPSEPDDVTPPRRRQRAASDVAVQRQPAGPEPAGVAARIAAIVVDLLILGVTDVAVVYFTMQICGLTPADFGILPKGPLIAFLLVQNGGYFITFTAGGQTLGKMVAGIRVVAAEPGASVDLGRSAVRTVIWGLLAIPAGLGFLTALFNRERRGLHDRCAGTRVVRAAA
jgi:uncharacterized RDD family membrane protein YckC